MQRKLVLILNTYPSAKGVIKGLEINLNWITSAFLWLINSLSTFLDIKTSPSLGSIRKVKKAKRILTRKTANPFW